MNTPTIPELLAKVQQLEAEIIDLKERNQRLREQLQAKSRTFITTEPTSSTPKVVKHGQINGFKLEAPLPGTNPESPLYGKRVRISGSFDQIGMSRDDLAEAIIKCGAIEAKHGHTKNMDFIIFGNDAGPSKMRDVEQWQAEGLPIKVLSQYDIKQIIDRYLSE